MKLKQLKNLIWTPIGSNGESSSIHKTIHQGKIIIKKQCKANPIHKQEYLNELACLLILQDSNHFPTLIAHDDERLILYMSYCGKRLNPQIRPLNWKEQINQIIEIITKKGIVYSDIKPDHLRVYNDNTIRLIDFGRSTVGPQHRRQDIHKIYKLAENTKYE